MPQFFFDFRDGGRDRGLDREGLDLADEGSAKNEAMTAVSQVIQLETFDDDRRCIECRVRDGRGREVYKVSLTMTGKWASDEARFPKFEQARRG